VKKWTSLRQGSCLREWIEGRDGSSLYEAFDHRAQWVKAVIQMLIGVGTVITIAVVVWFPDFRKIGIAELALRVVAVGLALAATVELAYTLFTDGPDEALDPLILGSSSFILIKISDPKTHLTMQNAGAFALFILVLGALFVIREVFIEKPKRDRAAANKPDDALRQPTSGEDQRGELAEGTGPTAYSPEPGGEALP
jgi:hypothetical protein